VGFTVLALCFRFEDRAAENRCLLALYTYMCRWRGGPDRDFLQEGLGLGASGDGGGAACRKWLWDKGLWRFIKAERS
jgi:hypothetical protein